MGGYCRFIYGREIARMDVSRCYQCSHYREEDEAAGICAYSDLPIKYKYGCSCFVPVVNEGLFDFNRSHDFFTNEERESLLARSRAKGVVSRE